MKEGEDGIGIDRSNIAFKVGSVMDWAWDYFGQVLGEQILDRLSGHAFDWGKTKNKSPLRPTIEAQRLAQD